MTTYKDCKSVVGSVNRITITERINIQLLWYEKHMKIKQSVLHLAIF